MRKYIGYVPAVLFTAFYLMVGITGASFTMSVVLIWLICFWISGVLFHKGLFWGSDTPIMEAPTELVNSMMSGIIEKVSDYRSKSNSIGFSFRYYVEGIIQNPDIKMLSVDGVAPTAENIENGSYSVVTPIYAVTYEENTNENVEKLLEWILSEEGQYILEETGYVGIISGQ